jgi:hypothetical protein
MHYYVDWSNIHCTVATFVFWPLTRSVRRAMGLGLIDLLILPRRLSGVLAVVEALGENFLVGGALVAWQASGHGRRCASSQASGAHACCGFLRHKPKRTKLQSGCSFSRC